MNDTVIQCKLLELTFSKGSFLKIFDFANENLIFPHYGLEIDIHN